MNVLVAEFARLGANPWAWGVAGLLTVFAAQAVVQLLRCPYARGTTAISDDDVARARANRFRPGARFALAVLGGAGLIVIGLFMIARSIGPAVAFGALTAGILILQTEPMRLQIREQTYAVIASRDAAPDVAEGQRDRLRENHRILAATNLGVLAAVVAVLLVF